MIWVILLRSLSLAGTKGEIGPNTSFVSEAVFLDQIPTIQLIMYRYILLPIAY